MINWLKMLMLFTLQTTDTSNLIPPPKKKKTMKQKQVKLKRKYLITIMINILLLKNIIT